MKTTILQPLARLASLLFVLLSLQFLAPEVSATPSRIFVPVKVNGQNLSFAFDTGAGAPVVMWNEVAGIMGVKSEGARPGTPAPGLVAFVQSDPVSLELFGQSFPDTRLVLVDAPEYAKWEMQGLIGWPAIRGALWRIDLGHSGVQPLARLPEDLSGWLKLRVAKTDDLALELPLGEGEPGLVFIDTGDRGGVSLAPKLWEEWRTAHPSAPKTLDATQMLTGGVAVSEALAADTWTLGALTLRKVVLQLAHPSVQKAHNAAYAATLGCDALRKLTLIVDGKNGWAYVRPHDDSPAWGAYNRLGAVFVPVDTKTPLDLEARVLPGGPADLAGLKDGDRLSKLNSQELKHWRKRPGSWPPGVFFTQKPGTELPLEVKRAGKTVETKPVLQELLSPEPGAKPKPSPAPLLLDFHFLPPQDDLMKKAAASGFPSGPVAPPESAGSLTKGDSVVMLITCTEDNRLQQWLANFVAKDLKPEEGKAHGKFPPLYTRSGRTLVFAPEAAAIAIHVAGPVSLEGKEGSFRDEWSGVVVTREFLSLGFASTALAARKFGSLEDGLIGFGGSAFSQEESGGIRARLEKAGVGEAEERAFVGGVMAIGEFFRLAAQTPGVRDVLQRMVDVSLKDLLRRPQLNIDIQPPVENLDPLFWGLPAGTPCYALNFRIDLNGVPRLRCRVAVTQPQPPLQTVAGVVGIAASKIDGSGPFLVARVLSSQRAKDSAKK